jgi:hypothetical protein
VYRCKHCGYYGSFMLEEDEPARNNEEQS